jgi:hypothetical protein
MKDEKQEYRVEKIHGRKGAREADYRVTFHPILPRFRGFIPAF